MLVEDILNKIYTHIYRILSHFFEGRQMRWAHSVADDIPIACRRKADTCDELISSQCQSPPDCKWFWFPSILDLIFSILHPGAVLSGFAFMAINPALVRVWCFFLI